MLDSPWASVKPGSRTETTDRVLRATKLEDSIYADLRTGDDGLAQTEQAAAKKLKSFPALSRDIYQSLYSLLLKYNEDRVLSTQARKFNAPILEHITRSADFPALKAVCEGRELPAYEAASEFITQTAGELDDLLSSLGGEKDTMNTLEKLENAEAQAKAELASLLEQLRQCRELDTQLEQMAVSAANKAESKKQQVTAVGKMVDAAAAKNQEAIAWGKAVALTLLEIAADRNRSFALIHFSETNRCQVDLFRPDEHSAADKMRAAETFLNGGTDFETPVNAALKLIEDGFEQADIVFITDGQCRLSDHAIQSLREKQAGAGFTMTGLLLDTARPGMTFSLDQFCQSVYRTSELLGDDIVRELVSGRV